MQKRQLYVGTSGWSYDDWSGVFYPEDLRASERLSYYVGQFPTLEINVTFYRLPSQAMLNAWNRRLPDDYQLIVKGSRVITHLARLHDCQPRVEAFWQRVSQLRALRVILWQLPPTLSVNTELLDRFLSSLPGEVRHAVEFRHASWWTAEVGEVLARHRAAFVSVSHPSLPEVVIPTTDFLYLRFHGRGPQLYNYDYPPQELAAWAARVQPYRADHTLYALFNNTYAGQAVHNARRFAELLSG